MNIELEKDTVADVVRKDYRAARVFKKHRIDFCCGGGKTIAQVCKDRKLAEDVLVRELNDALINPDEGRPDYDSWTLERLIDHIEQKHHRYIVETTPLLKQYLKKLVAVHGHAAPYLAEVASYFSESSGNLAQHMKKEELILFPFIRKMAKAQSSGEALARPHFASVANPIAMMLEEHDQEGENFRKMEELSNGYDIPDWACNTFAVTMNILQEFQDDLHLHIHLENNILFPRAVDLETRLFAPQTIPSACSLKQPNMP